MIIFMKHKKDNEFTDAMIKNETNKNGQIDVAPNKEISSNLFNENTREYYLTKY